MTPQTLDIFAFDIHSRHNQPISGRLLFRNSTPSNYHWIHEMKNEFICAKGKHPQINTFASAMICEWTYMWSGQRARHCQARRYDSWHWQFCDMCEVGIVQSTMTHAAGMTIHITNMYDVAQVRYDCEDRCRHT